MKQIKKNDKIKIDTEECVLCHKKLFIGKKANISLRNHYVEGVGQLCAHCYVKVYGNYK